MFFNVHPYVEEMIQFDEHILQVGGWNHQLENKASFFNGGFPAWHMGRGRESIPGSKMSPCEDRKFVDLLVVGSKGQSIGLEASKQVPNRGGVWSGDFTGQMGENLVLIQSFCKWWLHSSKWDRNATAFLLLLVVVM